jgi:hypothetical protein
MTDRDDITRMAQEAHRRLVTEDYPGHTGQLDPWTMTLLARFAALVAAAEREACAKEALAADDQGSVNQRLMQKRIAAAIRASGNK